MCKEILYNRLQFLLCPVIVYGGEVGHYCCIIVIKCDNTYLVSNFRLLDKFYRALKPDINCIILILSHYQQILRVIGIRCLFHCVQCDSPDKWRHEHTYLGGLAGPLSTDHIRRQVRPNLDRVSII